MITSPTRRKSLGQSLVEVAILMPVLLIMLSGLIEFGFALNQFLNILDAAREGARFGADGDPTVRAACNNKIDNDNDKIVDDCPDPGLGSGGNGFPDDYIDPNDLTTTCSVTNDFYMQVACVVIQTANPIKFDPKLDDIVISIYRVYDDPQIVPRNTYIMGQLPDYSRDPDLSAHDPISNTSRLYGQWRLYGNHVSELSQADIQNRLDPTAPGAGVLVVEVFYSYHHVLGLPWIVAFVPNPIQLRSFTIIPIPAAEPRPTPTPTPSPTNTSTPTRTSTPSPTVTNTGLPSITPTDTQTPTPTDTETPTITPIGCGVVDPTNSTLTVANGTQWADGVQAATVTVSIFDNCNPPQPLSGHFVQLTSSRGGLDTISLLTQTGNQSIFLVSSINLGTSTLTVVIDPPPASLNLTVTQTGTVTFVCVSGSGSPLAFFPQDVQYGFANPQNPPAPFAHTLRALTMTWNDQGGTRKLMTVKMGATVIWSSGSGVNSPFTINVADWTSISRTINPGASKSLVLSFNVSAAGGTYTLNPISWDDGSGGSICASAPVSATR